MDINKYKNVLNGQVVLITGAGGGIGYETAKIFAFMGCNVIIAEIDANKGEFAEKEINKLYFNRAEFYNINLANEDEIIKMKDYILNKYGCPDVIFNNATCINIGAVNEISSVTWDTSYKVILKAPILLFNNFISEMKKKDSGTFVFVSSSGAAAYMGSYEIFKTSQVELSNTIALELENSGIYSYTIGPGLVKTDTAMKAINVVANNMNITTEEFYEMNKSHIITVEDAALGFALSVLNAKDYHGQEVGSIQVLNKLEQNYDKYSEHINVDTNLFKKIIKTYTEQYTGWKKLNIFERQWIIRDFKKRMGYSVDEVFEKLNDMGSNISRDDIKLLENLKLYWNHQLELLQGFEKDKEKLKENTDHINSWIKDIDILINI